MTQVNDIIDNVRKAAETHGLAALAREADVPYTTVKSFSDRGWSNKNLQVIDALARASDRLAGASS
jgi:lambda repressor-like predicted transcriptional regulator